MECIRDGRKATSKYTKQEHPYILKWLNNANEVRVLSKVLLNFASGPYIVQNIRCIV